MKICGLTRAQDAAHAVALGASWLGVVFAGGPRLVSARCAAEIVRAAGGKPVLGVFGSQTADEILRLRDEAGLWGAQLHGAHSPELPERLLREGMRILEVVRMASVASLDRLHALRALRCPVLVEPLVAGALGGSGVALSLDLAVRARARLLETPMFLAGGLTPDTVTEAIERVRPDAVDVSSGVEQIPGVKDRDRMARFLEAVDGHNAST